MIGVFKTNVVCEQDAKLILGECTDFFPSWQVNFDLEDCDKILRIDSFSETIIIEQVKNIVTKFGYAAELLND